METKHHYKIQAFTAYIPFKERISEVSIYGIPSSEKNQFL